MTRIYSNPPLKNTNSMLATRPNNLSLVDLYLSLYISFLSFGHPPYFFIFFREHHYTKAVESIQLACAGNSGTSQVPCNANTHRSTHEGPLFNSSPAPDPKTSLETPLCPFPFLLASSTI